MTITRVITSKVDLKANLLPILEEAFSLELNYAERIYDNIFSQHIDQIIDTAWIFIESPYTDKVYRDSYYTYYSSKLGHYHKECIRLSFFANEITEEAFKEEDSINELQKNYLGFIVIRPTDPNILGRSVISPKGVKNNSFLSETAIIHNTVNSIKFQIEGFPHSSQDTETITCAETTLWAIMEYYGHKYAEYKPVLPSKIIEALKGLSAERQVPSKGLNIQQMAFALKEFGFGTRIYARGEFGREEFKRLLSCYVESGIPIIVALENRMHHGGNIGHAILAVGHERTKEADIDSLKPTTETNAALDQILINRQITLFDNDDIDRKFVFIDDNLPIYQLANIDTPAIHYKSAAWHNCEITYFVAPLYPKMYLEAYEAKSFFKRIMLDFYPQIPPNSELYIRFYLTSSRSFKHHLTLNKLFDATIKELILEMPLPKFIWVGELSTKDLIKRQEANGLFILDATEANLQSGKALMLSAYLDEYITYDESSKSFTSKNLPIGTFSIFTNNLKGF